jgi:ATP synthase protein I
MVPAAFEGDGASFSIHRKPVSGVYDMADGSENGSRDTPSSDEAALSARLGDLNHRLSEIKGSRKTQAGQTGAESGDQAANASAMARGLRLSSELVVGVLVGALIGWGLDKLLSTSPWGMIVFLLLGFAAGVRNVVRSASMTPGQSGR